MEFSTSRNADPFVMPTINTLNVKPNIENKNLSNILLVSRLVMMGSCENLLFLWGDKSRPL